MVHSVMAVPAAGKLKRDHQRSTYSDDHGRNFNSLFESILKDTPSRSENAPRACQTTLYDRNSRLQSFQYLSREYHY